MNRNRDFSSCLPNRTARLHYFCSATTQPMLIGVCLYFLPEPPRPRLCRYFFLLNIDHLVRRIRPLRSTVELPPIVRVGQPRQNQGHPSRNLDPVDGTRAAHASAEVILTVTVSQEEGIDPPMPHGVNGDSRRESSSSSPSGDASGETTTSSLGPPRRWIGWWRSESENSRRG